MVIGDCSEHPLAPTAAAMLAHVDPDGRRVSAFLPSEGLTSFGCAVAIHGATAVVGAPEEQTVRVLSGIHVGASPIGASCADATDCGSGHCVDGSCCNSACGGSCEVCSVAAGAERDGYCTSTCAEDAGPTETDAGSMTPERDDAGTADAGPAVAVPTDGGPVADDPAGCSCRVTRSPDGSSPTSSALTLLLAALGLRRRRAANAGPA
jgi:MYXO-CTERM domain-containing protein